MINSKSSEWVSRGKSIFQFVLTRCKAGYVKGKTIFQQSPWYKKILLSGAAFIVLFFIYLVMVDINFLWLFGKSPSLSSISNPNQSVASVIYSADGKAIGKYFRENRTPVEYEEISPILIKTLIATEDERFYEHFGIDFQGLFAAVKDMIS